MDYPQYGNITLFRSSGTNYQSRWQTITESYDIDICVGFDLAKFRSLLAGGIDSVSGAVSANTVF